MRPAASTGTEGRRARRGAGRAAALVACGLVASAAASAQEPGEPGGSGLALRAAKVLICPFEGRQLVDDGVLLVRDGLVEAVGTESEVAIPAGYEVLDVGESWLMPGMVGLHSHIAGSGEGFNVLADLNDGVYLTNPGLRCWTAVRPDTSWLRRAVAGGVTTILYIPGSGTNISGQGVLLKTGFEHYPDMEVRNPGSLKLAQAGNPERWIARPQRALMNWNTRNTLRRGLAYAKRWQDYEDGRGPEPAVDPQWEVFRALAAHELPVATHTQMYQVVNMTITMVRAELGLDVFIDHGTFDGYLAAERAEELGVPAILGPRSVQIPSRLHIQATGGRNDGTFQGVAASYQERGHTMIGFNTDAPIVDQEELSQQAAVAVRYGFEDEELDTVRGLTIVPARTAGIDDEVGSLEPGKQADVLVVTGHPADARSSIELVLIEGRRVYDAGQGRRW